MEMLAKLDNVRRESGYYKTDIGKPNREKCYSVSKHRLVFNIHWNVGNSEI